MIPRKIHFKNGRYLLYLNKQNLTTPYLLDLHYLIPMTYFGYLIANNPCNYIIIIFSLFNFPCCFANTIHGLSYMYVNLLYFE